MDEPDQSSSPHRAPEDQPPRSIGVEIADGLGLLSASASEVLRANAARALRMLGAHGEVRVRIVNDEQMIQAHRRFSGLDTTTDVLTFDLAYDSGSLDTKVLDTDLTICFDQAQRQAEAHHHPVEQELLLYIIHGSLHCLGYDDHTETDYQQMHKKEDELLAKIGIAPTFFTEEPQS